MPNRGMTPLPRLLIELEEPFLPFFTEEERFAKIIADYKECANNLEACLKENGVFTIDEVDELNDLAKTIKVLRNLNIVLGVKAGISRARLAQMHDISESRISQIVNGGAYTGIPWPNDYPKVKITVLPPEE